MTNEFQPGDRLEFRDAGGNRSDTIPVVTVEGLPEDEIRILSHPDLQRAYESLKKRAADNGQTYEQWLWEAMARKAMKQRGLE